MHFGISLKILKRVQDDNNIMKLPFLNFGKKEIKNYFLALLLQDEKVGAVILEELNGTIHVVGHAEEHFPTALEEASFEEWLAVVDKAVSTAEQNLPGKIQTEKTVFGVKQDWIIEGKIKRGYLTRLKKICEELALQPIGFLVFTEAILHLLQKEEGAPVSAILVELGKKFILISIVRAGRIIETKLIPFEEPVQQTVDKALKDFSVEILPSRIILSATNSNKQLTQSFITHLWSKSLPFLHMPQVTVLPEAFDTKSVLYGTAAQLGFIVGTDALPSKIQSAKIIQPQKPIEESKEQTEEEQEETQEEELDRTEQEEEEEIEQEETTQLPDTVSADYFGFVQDADVATTAVKPKKQPISQEVFDETIENLPEEEKEEESEEFSSSNFSTSAFALFSGIKQNLVTLSKQKSIAKLVKPLVPLLSHLAAMIPPRTDKPHRKQSGMKEQDISSFSSIPLPWIIAGGTVVVCVLFVLLYIFGISAHVSLTVTPKVLTSQQPISFVTDGATDVDTGVLLGQTVSTDEKGSLSEQTTGTKEVGTPSKGQITIFSTLTDTTTIPKGTTIISDNNLKYTLDSNVTVASSSGYSGDVVTVPNVSVTASDIGPAYDLPSGAKFSVNGFDKGSVSGKNDTAFSGGTKKDVIVVSQADIDKLSSDVTKSMEDKAKADLAQQTGNGKMLLPFFTKEDLSQQTISGKVGDQTQNLSLDGTITYQALAVDKADITSLASHELQGTIPSDMVLTSDGIQTDVTDVKQANNTVTGTLIIKASLQPKIDTSQLAKELAGKSFQEANDIVKALPQIQSVNFVLSPNLFFLPKILPRLASHIVVTLTSQ